MRETEERVETKIRLIIADDNSATSSVVRDYLGSFGGIDVVAIAQNGEEAVNLCAQFQPDVVLMDLGMPVMDGVTATRLIRQQCPATQVIILSVAADGDSGSSALEAGASACISKLHPQGSLIDHIRLVYRPAPQSQGTPGQTS